jgi:hypothetical protein
MVVNESDKANVLNNYFCFISSTPNNIDSPNLPRRQRHCCIYAVTPWRAHRQVKKNEKKKKKNVLLLLTV